MAPKAAAIISPSGGTATASDDSVSPPAPASVHGRQKLFMQACTPCAANCGFQVTWHATHCCALCQKKRGAPHGPRCERKPMPAAPEEALEDASSSPSMQLQEQARQGSPENDVFPYGITVPFRVREAIPGNKCASARVFLSEAPISALKDMCFYLQIEEAGSIDDLVARILNYFVQLYPHRAKANSKKETLTSAAAGPTPARARTQTSQIGTAKVHGADAMAYGGGQELRARLQKLGKVTYGSKEALVKRLHEAEAEVAKIDAKKKRTSEEPKPALKKQKTTEKLQTQLPWLSR